MDSPAPPAPRYWSLDILRGLCALAVFLNHWVLWSDFPPVGPWESGLQLGFERLYEAFVILVWPTGGQHPAVVCFFVLSGFCVHGPFERKVGPSTAVIDWRSYFVRRARRIMPVYWVASLLGLLVVAAEAWRPSGNATLWLHAAATPAQVAARFGGYGGLWLEEIFAGNYTLGTVAVEILIYLAYPLFFFLAAAGRWRLLGGIAVGLHGIALLLQPFINPFVLFSGILVMALFWYLGALAAHLRHQRAWIVRGWWIAMAWAVFLTLKAMPHFYGRNLLKQAAWGLVCMLAIVWLLDWERAHAGWRDRLLSRIMRYCGDLSYSLYAVHTPVIFLVTWTMLTVFEIRSYSWQLLASFGLCLLISVAVHHGIEKKFYRSQARAIPPLPSS